MKKKKQKAIEAAAKKKQAKIERLENELQKAKLSSIPPKEYFKIHPNHKDGGNGGGNKWHTYDEGTGKPTSVIEADGTVKELSKSQGKSITKELKNHEKAYEKLKKAAGGGEDAIEAYVEN